MGLFNYLGKVFGKAKVRNKGSFHSEDEPFGKYADPTAGKSAKSQREAKEAMRRLEEYFPGVTEAKTAAQEAKAQDLLNEVEEEEFAKAMAEEAEKGLYRSEVDAFIFGGDAVFIEASEHVLWMQYINKEELLYIGYHTNMSIYEYRDISEQEARLYFSLIGTGKTPTVGTNVVWKYLRQRGTAFGWQKNYQVVPGAAPKPKYMDQPHWEAEHGAIPESGMPPLTWIYGGGPYGDKVTPFKPHWY